jgi:sugar/nucleoside kinase (ribokinase family)
MPDLFIDRFVTFSGDVKQLSAAIAKVAERTGGNIHGVKQIEIRGGNAANTAAALAVLNVKAFPIITTSQFGLHLLKFFLGRLGVDLSHVKTHGELALTTAFEVAYGDEMVNIMMGDLGSLPNFGPKNLTQKDYDLLREVDYACLFNWASTSRWGNELAEKVFRYVKEEGKGKTYYDTGDPTPNKRDIPKLVEKILKSDLIDILSVNENEAFQYASQLDSKVNGLRNRLNHHELARECARTLAKHISARVDLHTTTFAGSFTHENEIVIPIFPVSALRSTGAGDSWNAGNIYGDALRIPDSCRITMANAVAAYYVSSPSANHPTIPKLIEFCQKQLQLKNNSLRMRKQNIEKK